MSNMFLTSNKDKLTVSAMNFTKKQGQTVHKSDVFNIKQGQTGDKNDVFNIKHLDKLSISEIG